MTDEMWRVKEKVLRGRLRRLARSGDGPHRHTNGNLQNSPDVPSRAASTFRHKHGLANLARSGEPKPQYRSTQHEHV